MSKERPILMTPDNAQKCHVGTKTQTRRIMAPQPESVRNGATVPYYGSNEFLEKARHCPYGVVGGRLWVKHLTWKPKHLGNIINDHRWNPITQEIIWRVRESVLVSGVNEDHWRKVTGRFMPRWACRTVLEITNVRVERVQDISEEDAIAEGVVPDDDDRWNPVQAFEHLWESIHGEGSWELNPFVWCLSFRRVDDAR